MAITNKQLAELLATVTVGADHEATLNVAYQTAFGRNVDDEGLAYWSDRLENGLDAETELLEALLDGADAYEENAEYPENVAVNATDKTVIENKSEVAEAILANTAVTNEQAETILATVTTDASKASALDDVAAIVPAPVIDGETFVLTKSVDDEVHNGTAASDLFDATELGSLQDGDLLLDNSTTDNDILNASVNSDTIKARIQNVETLNIQGEYVKTGLDLTNVSGTTDLNLSTKIAGGVATVTAANSLNAAAINAGTNIATLDITSLTSGTRDAVTVDAGAAKTINLTGAAAGADVYDVTVTDGAKVTLATIDSAGDSVTLNAAGDIELDSAQGVAAAPMDQFLGLTINATDDLKVELSQSAAAALIAKEVALSGSGDITLVSTNGADLAGTASAVPAPNYNGVAVTATNTGTSTLEIEALATATATATNDFSKAAVDTVELSGALAADSSIILNADSSLHLTANMAAAANHSLTVDVDNGTADSEFEAGAAIVKVSQAQTGTGGLVTGTSVDTLIVSAEADKVTDYDQDENGFNEVSSMNMGEASLSAVWDGAESVFTSNTGVMVIQGTENITYENINVQGYGQVISASSFEGNLNIKKITDNTVVGDNTKAITVVGGKGNDSITTGAALKFDVQAMYGSNTVNVATAAADTEVTTGAGNDRITSSANATVINAGAGDDTVTAAGDDTITLGDGADKVVLADTITDVLVKDFVKGTDTVVLSGGVMNTATNLNLSLLDAPVEGLYTIDGATNDWTIKLQNAGTNLTARDMRDSIQVSGVTLADDSVNVLGDKDDSVIVAADEAAIITTGAGSDTVTIAAGADGAAVGFTTNATIKDFAVGEDKVVLTGAIAVDTNVNLKNVADVNGVYTVGNATDGQSFKLENDGSDILTENNLQDMVQLGNSTTYFTVQTTAVATPVAVTGSNFNDFVELKAALGTATYNFTMNGGVDTIKLTPNDALTKLNFNQLTGIDSGVANGKVFLTDTAAKVADAKDSAVYVFEDSANGAGGAEITTFVPHTANGYTQEVINDEIAAYINAGLGATAGENYVVIINDTSSTTYQGEVYGGKDALTTNYDAYAFYVTADSSTITADNVTLIGQLDTGAALTGDLDIA